MNTSTHRGKICLQKKGRKRRKQPFSVSTAYNSAEPSRIIYGLTHLDVLGGPVTESEPPDIISRILHGACPIEFRYSPEGQALVDGWYQRTGQREKCLFPITYWRPSLVKADSDRDQPDDAQSGMCCILFLFDIFLMDAGRQRVRH